MARAFMLSAMTALGIAIAAPTALPEAQEADPIVGAEACRDCHTDYYQAWSTTKHARAFSRLSGGDRSNGECIQCHVTDTAAMLAASNNSPKHSNVQCEACHGAGRAHIEAAKAGNAASATTAPANEEMCRRCHNLKSPHYKTFIYAALVGLVHRVQAP